MEEQNSGGVLMQKNRKDLFGKAFLLLSLFFCIYIAHAKICEFVKDCSEPTVSSGRIFISKDVS